MEFSSPLLASLQELGISIKSYEPSLSTYFVSRDQDTPESLRSDQGAIQIVPYSNEHDGVVQIAKLSLLDLRYNYKNFRSGPSDAFPIGWLEGYFADTMVTLYYLVPNHQSYQIAEKVGLVSECLHIDWKWWENNVIANSIFYINKSKFYIPGSAMVHQMKALRDLYQNRRQAMKIINALKNFSIEKITYLKFLYPNIESRDNAVAANGASLERFCEKAQTYVALAIQNICARYEYNVTGYLLEGPSYNVSNSISDIEDRNSNNSDNAANKIKTFNDLIQIACNPNITRRSNGTTSQHNSFHLLHIKDHEVRYSILPLLKLFFNQGSIFLRFFL